MSESEEQIQFDCPRCTSNISVDAELAGKRTECPACEDTVMVPIKSARPALFEDIFDSVDVIAPPDSNEPSESDADAHDSDLDLLPIENSASPEDDLIPLDDEEPAPDLSNEPLRVEGLEHLYGHDDVYAVRCKICDTQIQLRPEKDKDFVECPVCYSKVPVAPPKDQKPAQKWIKDGRGKDTNRVDGPNDDFGPNDDLKLADPVEIPDEVKAANPYLARREESALETAASEAEMESPLEIVDESELDQADELEVIEEAPPNLEDIPPLEIIEKNEPAEEADEIPPLEEIAQSAPNPDDIPELEVISDNVEKPTVVPRSQIAKKQKRPKKLDGDASGANRRPLRQMSRREKYEAAQQRQREKAGRPAFEFELKETDESNRYYPPFQLKNLAELGNAILVMLTSPGLGWRIVVSTLFLCIGAIITAGYVGKYEPPREEVEVVAVEPTFLEGLRVWAESSIFGGIPYLIGVFCLWYTCSFVFREAALGQQRVESWRNSGVNEFLGTFALFAFGFFLGGLPALFLTLLILPLRMMFSPLLLLGAWYNQSPFAIVNADVFKNVPKEMGQWLAFYMVMLALGLLSFMAGMMFWVRAWMTSHSAAAFVSILGVLIVVFVTVVFAAVCGWHCGRVVNELEKSA